jgi:hypothetical protein
LKRIDLRDFIKFLKTPYQGEHYKITSISLFLRLLWNSFLILVLIDIIVGILIVLPLRYLNLFPLLREFNFTSYNIIRAILIFPIIEELIFRFPLKISKITFSTSFSLIIFLILNKWCLSSTYIALSISILLFLLLYFSINEESSIPVRVAHFLRYPFWIIFYFQAVIFGILHLTNYVVDFKYFYLFPFIVVSYILKGCLFGYLRVRFSYGIYLCISSHILVNSIYCFILKH